MAENNYEIDVKYVSKPIKIERNTQNNIGIRKKLIRYSTSKS